MSLINNLQNATHKASESGEEYINATQEYIELKTFQQIALTFSLLVKILLIGGLLFIAITLLLIAGVITLGKVLGSINAALVYTSLGFVLLSLIIYLFRKSLLDNPIIKKLANSFFSKLVD